MTGPAAGAGQGENDALRAQLHTQGVRMGAMVRAADQLREANEHLLLASVDAQNLRDAAQQAQLRQNQFLAMLAHELRNPLAPIGMANALLAKLPAASPELLSLHAIIARQVAHLTRLLDDLLDAARISSGKIELALGPLELSALLKRAVSSIAVNLIERAQTMTLDLPEEMVVEGDSVCLAQVFANLLVNASKFMGNGGLLRLSARTDRGEAVVTVADNGAGILPDVMPHIFDLFTQGPRALARSEGGLGVGLNVVRNIVQLHGGSVSAASDGAGAGSVFTVRLPLSSRTPVPDIAPAVPAPSTMRRILVVEDNLDANDTLGRLLGAAGHHVVSAYDGVAGLGLARKHDFDVLLCDIGLPGMNGLELISRLRASAGVRIPFAIAISGYGQEEDRVRAISAGYGQYFVKPVDAETLLALIASDAVSQFIAAVPGTR